VTHPNDPGLRSFINVDPVSDFPIQNLPYGVFSTAASPTPRVGVAIGNFVLDLAVLESEGLVDPAAGRGVFAQASINAFMALGPEVWSRTRARISALLRHDNPELRDDAKLRERALLPMADARLLLPVAVAGYTDFYSSKEHATNVGTMFRDKSNPLLPNWLHIPIGYNGRASTVVVSGTRVRRPRGQLKPPNAELPIFGRNDNQRRMTRAEIPLRRSPPLIAPPSRRAGFDASCENPREMALIGKAGVQGDLAQRIVGIENELLRPLHALMKQPLMRSTSDRLLESPAKMTGRQATGTGQLRETEIARQVRP